MDSRAEQRGWREQIVTLAHAYQEVYQPSNNESWGMGYWKGVEFALDCAKEEIAAERERVMAVVEEVLMGNINAVTFAEDTKIFINLIRAKL